MRSDHGTHRQRLGSTSRRQAFNSGGVLVHNGGLLRFWSRNQKAVSLSSWESELYAAVSSGTETLALQRQQAVVDHTARR